MCGLFGVSRQAHYKWLNRSTKQAVDHRLLKEQVQSIRSRHPQMGGKKLYALLQSFKEENAIKMGRDAFYTFLFEHKLLLRRRIRRARTTFSNHCFKIYDNLIKDLKPTRPNQLWVSDITYYKTPSGFLYISLITDAYSHKIVGHNIADNLRAEQSIQALDMALRGIQSDQKTSQSNQLIHQLIHHSDRGIQYCSKSYTELLKKRSVSISMTQSGDPLENPLAERINGIIKNEYLKFYPIKNVKQGRIGLNRAVKLYNTERPHLSLGMNTPEHIHQKPKTKTKQLWKTYYKLHHKPSDHVP